jgi:hypothetical protein
LRRIIWFILLSGCAADNDCEALWRDLPPIEDVSDVERDVEAVRAELFPELAEVSIEVGEMTSETDFFVANLELSSFDNPPLLRDYLVLHNPEVFDDPPPRSGVIAILAHELKHVVDYTGMDSEALAEFALWYASEDTAAYERETDEHSLALGCGEGLIEYRLWLYDRLEPGAVEEKRRVYYTPEEIEAWMDANAE